MEKKKIVIIGGSAAGPKTAAKARRLDEHAEIILLQKDKDLSMASCGYPYYVGGVFDNRNELISTPTGVVRDPKFFLNAKGIDARTETEVIAIDPQKHRVTCKYLATGEVDTVNYDKLVICTGAHPVIPPIPGTDMKGITTLQSMRDADFLRKVRDEKSIKKAVVIGGGLIGIETCEALHLAGIDITVVELAPQLLTFLDWEMAAIVENHVRAKGANVITNNGVAAFLGENGQLTGVKLANGTELPCELAVVAIGVKPNVALAQAAGLSIGATGGIVVNEFMQTSDPDIYSAGDCVESYNMITGTKVHAPMGDLANLQGRVAGENVILGNSVSFPGVLQTGICKVFDFAAGSTGLTETRAKNLGYNTYETVVNTSPDKPGFMGAGLLISKMLADKDTGKILGVQCVGTGDVSKQLATATMALTGGFTVEQLINLDMPYAPPFSLAIDHFVATAHLMQNKLKGRLQGISPCAVHEKLENNEKPFMLDVRGPDEFEQMRLGIGETLIPSGVLRQRLNELPQDKETEIICYCKISLRGYEAQLVLNAHGWKNVKVMEGGVMAWPYPREK